MSPAAEVLLRIGITLGVVLGVAPLLVWAERRLLAAFQDRYGPNRVGPLGLLQVLADGIKLLTKEDWIPPFADPVPYVLAPAIVVVTALLSFAVIPFGPEGAIVDLNVGLLYFLALAAMSVYGILLAGVSSNSKYALLGSVRAGAQLISYELALGLSLASVVLLAGSFNLREIVLAQEELPYLVVQPLGFAIFLVAGIAESKRLPFDLPEAENELVAGYHTEYSSMKFALFFLGEYVAVVLFGCIGTVAFLGGGSGPWLPPVAWFAIKVSAFVYLFVWARGTLPRLRYDQLMALGWKGLIPLALLNLAVTGAVVVARANGGG